MIKSTTKAAVRTQTQSKLATDRKKIIAALKTAPKQGRTRHELSHITGVSLQTICWRISDLITTGQVFIDGRKVFKKHSEQPCEAVHFNFKKEDKEA